ncbi:unnamed protein product [Amaranthus hypochondriacus]
MKQQITIPFEWEETPGAPKQDWKPKRNDEHEPLNCVPFPVKYVASVPFKWEEKPGTPLGCFARGSTKRRTQENKILPLPPAYFRNFEDESDDQDWMSELEFDDTTSHQSEESLCSAPALVYDPLSSESDRNSINYATGNPSLRGAAFLAHLFPLHPYYSRIHEQVNKMKVNERKQALNIGDGGRSGIIRKPLSLAQLIMQSRKRSYGTKAVNIKKRNQQKELTKSTPQGCFNIVASAGRLAKMLRKDFLTLKLS